MSKHLRKILYVGLAGLMALSVGASATGVNASRIHHHSHIHRVYRHKRSAHHFKRAHKRTCKHKRNHHMRKHARTHKRSHARKWTDSDTFVQNGKWYKMIGGSHAHPQAVRCSKPYHHAPKGVHFE